MLRPLRGALFIALLLSAGDAYCREPDQVGHYLDVIDSQDFVKELVGDAGGDPATVEMLLTHQFPEFQYLVQHSAEAIPRMIGRVQTPDGIRYAPARLVYFIFFGCVKDPKALPVLADYLDSLPDSDERQARPEQLVGVNLFPYALMALEEIRGPSAFLGLSSPVQIFHARHRIAEHLRMKSAPPSGRN